jgi:hypothetical protein
MGGPRWGTTWKHAKQSADVVGLRDALTCVHRRWCWHVCVCVGLLVTSAAHVLVAIHEIWHGCNVPTEWLVLEEVAKAARACRWSRFGAAGGQKGGGHMNSPEMPRLPSRFIPGTHNHVHRRPWPCWMGGC